MKVNQAINNYRYLSAACEVLNEEVHISDSIANHWKTIVVQKDSLIKLEEEKYELAQKVNFSLARSLEQQKRKSRNTIIGVGVGAALVGGLVSLLLCK